MSGAAYIWMAANTAGVIFNSITLISMLRNPRPRAKSRAVSR